MSYNNLIYSDKDEIANSFAHYFSSVFKQPTTQYYKFDNCNMLTIDFNTCELKLCDIYEICNCKIANLT